MEGLARSGPYLWAVGSHSLRRRQIKPKHSGMKALRRLAQVTGQASRQILLRIPVEDDGGLPTLEAAGERLTAAAFGTGAPGLRDLPPDDEHLAPVSRGEVAGHRAPQVPGAGHTMQSAKPLLSSSIPLFDCSAVSGAGCPAGPSGGRRSEVRRRDQQLDMQVPVICPAVAFSSEPFAYRLLPAN